MQLFKDIQSGCEADPCQPLIAYLNAQKLGKFAPPYIPQWDLMPLSKLCKLARLWSETGFREEAGRLAHWLLQFKEFPSLWCPEKEYKGGDFFSDISKIEPIAGDNPDFGLTLYRSASLSAAFTLAGNGTSLGVVRTKEVEIRSIGPQALPLSESNRFGIKGRGMDGWTRSFALPEVWLQLKAECKETECKIDVQFVGLKPERAARESYQLSREKELFAPFRSGESSYLKEEVLQTPLAFVFYVKAQSCQIGNETLKPKSLRRFLGEENRVKFGSLTIESSQKYKVQVIPLAGEGCFWDTEFLVAFEMHPFDSQATFHIQAGTG